MPVYILGGLVSSWLVITPLLWAQRPLHASLAIAIGAAGIVLAATAAVWAPSRGVMAVLGFILGLSALTIPSDIGQLANNCSVGVALILAGVVPGVKSHVVVAESNTVPTVLRRKDASAGSLGVRALAS